MLEVYRSLQCSIILLILSACQAVVLVMRAVG